MNKRTAEEILKDLCEEIVKYNARRDDEWDFADEHGIEGYNWTDEDNDEHEEILADILKGRDRIRTLLREATGDITLDF